MWLENVPATNAGDPRTGKENMSTKRLICDSVSLFSFPLDPHFYSETLVESMNSEIKWGYTLK